MSNILKKAFMINLPVMVAFIFLGIAYGMLMESNGYGPIWSFFISLLTFAGAAQFAMVAFLSLQVHPLSVFFIVLVLNARHLFYGISMLKSYQSMGKTKIYLFLGLCDETFGLVNTVTISNDKNKKKTYLYITILNHFYWVLGSTLGGLLGGLLTFEIKGLEFILTALFVSVFVSQFKKAQRKTPAYIGLIVSIISLVIFKENFIIPAMLMIIGLLLIDQKRLIKGKI
ncbi:MAG: branched-chain amino acid ABC transporter permease [Tenericutes bacterium HGW-Tenericutes-3]|nr:MAG: branched-chain amino acid ABC transporter permease [Tenericutes bacterium HGW-Tenericutes-3]